MIDEGLPALFALARFVGQFVIVVADEFEAHVAEFLITWHEINPVGRLPVCVGPEFFPAEFAILVEVNHFAGSFVWAMTVSVPFWVVVAFRVMTHFDAISSSDFIRD